MAELQMPETLEELATENRRRFWSREVFFPWHQKDAFFSINRHTPYRSFVTHTQREHGHKNFVPKCKRDRNDFFPSKTFFFLSKKILVRRFSAKKKTASNFATPFFSFFLSPTSFPCMYVCMYEPNILSWHGGVLVDETMKMTAWHHAIIKILDRTTIL
jgi:hypothetical protein